MSLPAEAHRTHAELPPLQFKGGQFSLMVLRLSDPKDPQFFGMLADKIALAPNFFRNAPVVLDLQDLAEAPPFNLAEVGRRLRQHQLCPIAVQNGTEEQNRAAVNAGLTVLPEGRRSSLDLVGGGGAPATAGPVAAVREPANESAPSLVSPSRLVVSPVRSGRQIYAQGGDLVVMAPTSPGAELLADGHIHIYGPLRGRALAGVSGDTAARIFCRSLEAELVSVAGIWRVREDLPETLIGQPAQVYLQGEKLMIEALG